MLISKLSLGNKPKAQPLLGW